MSKQVNLGKAVRRGEPSATAQRQGEDGAPAGPAGEAVVQNAAPVLRRARRARRRASAAFGTKWRLASVLAAAFFVAFQSAAVGPAQAAPAKPASAPAAAAGPQAPLAPCSATTLAPPASITLGKSTLIKLPAPVARLVIGGLGAGYAGKPMEMEIKDLNDAKELSRMRQQGTQQAGPVKNGVGEADVMLLSPTELYLLGKRVGSMNVILQDRTDKCTVMDVIVTVDSGSLQAKLAQLMPEERNVRVAAADDTLIVSGEVSDALKVERVMALAAAYAQEKHVVNLMRTRAASQVMLEVKVAEVSKSLLDQLGAHLSSVSNGAGGAGRWTWALLSEFLTSGSGFVQALKLGKTQLTINGEKDDGIVRVLAEPNIMAISGQQASFLSGGKIFIPVARDSGVGGTTITLEEKEFGVGVKFTPIVLDGDRINLKVASEVSELSQTGSPFTTVGGITAVLPSFTTRRADTTVQLKDGQSFAIAGLIKNNVSESVKRFPGLGEVPILGALFRSSEFQRDMTELVFIITPRLVKPLPPNYPLPTDNFREPTRGEFLLGGTLEGTGEMPGKGQRPAPVSDAGGATAVKAPPVPSDGPADESPKPAVQPQLSVKAAVRASSQTAVAVDADACGPSPADAPQAEEAVASPVTDAAASIVPIPAAPAGANTGVAAPQALGASTVLLRDGDDRSIFARAGGRLKTDVRFGGAR